MAAQQQAQAATNQAAELRKQLDYCKFQHECADIENKNLRTKMAELEQRLSSTDTKMAAKIDELQSSHAAKIDELQVSHLREKEKEEGLYAVSVMLMRLLPSFHES